MTATPIVFCGICLTMLEEKYGAYSCPNNDCAMHHFGATLEAWGLFFSSLEKLRDSWLDAGDKAGYEKGYDAGWDAAKDDCPHRVPDDF